MDTHYFATTVIISAVGVILVVLLISVAEGLIALPLSQLVVHSFSTQVQAPPTQVQAPTDTIGGQFFCGVEVRLDGDVFVAGIATLDNSGVRNVNWNVTVYEGNGQSLDFRLDSRNSIMQPVMVTTETSNGPLRSMEYIPIEVRFPSQC